MDRAGRLVDVEQSVQLVVQRPHSASDGCVLGDLRQLAGVLGRAAERLRQASGQLVALRKPVPVFRQRG